MGRRASALGRAGNSQGLLAKLWSCANFSLPWRPQRLPILWQECGESQEPPGRPCPEVFPGPQQPLHPGATGFTSQLTDLPDPRRPSVASTFLSITHYMPGHYS